ncbi:MAG: hypothetical protein A2381_14500 [Bdellovibrionales bacterium RIFOXYB1_FULL_37_110]|nr:MAG: hypothetical protein A2417_03160 [Bdellovibrionales bacterium RIFOXYC1_FULL_37_79]OFZ58350.1 MAG: hypothetical protein A2381_14500 [Bdellovibrionales bacterium RIFOXYB1_FULL_37_110]OFZ62688.1 MAG: hypothetical protein A2577_02210 [Bdellovibrionales bacterium RIFOXYD1_FULL_36_51]
MRKMLFIIFTDDDCKLNHALLYANDLKGKGHKVKIILEGVATKVVGKLDQVGNDYLKKLFSKALADNLIVGACAKASSGCQNPKISVSSIMEKKGIEMLNELNGHASISEYMEDGYELVIF